jgi:hypothetical protein
MEIISRDQARASGLRFFYTGQLCRQGHDSERYVNSGKCKHCNSIRTKEYREKNRDQLLAKQRAFRTNYPDLVKERKRQDYLKHRDKRRAAINRWNAANKDKVLAYLREWRVANADRFRAAKRAYYLEKKRHDPAFLVLTRLRRRLNHYLSGGSRCASAKELLGCTLDEFLRHIELQFPNGMNWENRNEWHIDHIIPCAAFDLTDPEQQRRCFHYTNMRPLWAHENRRKGASMPEAA